MRALRLITMSVLLGGWMLAAGALAEPMREMPLELTVPSAPALVRADGKTHLVYELHMTNFDPRGRDLKVIRLEVATEAGAKPLLTLEGDALAGVMLQPGKRDAADKTVLAGGIRGVAFLWVDLDEGAPVPASLIHRVTIQGETGEKTMEGGRTPVKSAAKLVLGPPLRGAGWLAAVGPSNVSGHRRTFITLDGRPRIAQRFAIDFARLAQDGMPFQGDPAKNESWLGYGQDVLAVADAVVASVNDGVPENTPLAPERAVKIDVFNAGGNYVILDLGEGRYAFYAHLQPGSLKVKPGDHVKKGQVLALLGDSGNSDAPHLHFHVADADSPLGSEGQPYVFESFEIEGRVDSIDAILAGRPAKLSLTKEARTGEIPLENVIVSFP